MDAGSNSETNDMKFRKVYDGPALQEVITKPLEPEGIDSFASTVDDSLTFMTVNKHDASYFRVELPPELIIAETTVVKALQIKHISFNEGPAGDYLTVAVVSG